jgi:hypothetical protein
MSNEIRPNDPSSPIPGHAFPAALILLLLILALAVFRMAPPSPVPESAPADQFSAGRAHAVLANLTGDGSPHPVGSPAQAQVRERVLATLRSMGYQARVEQGLGCQDGQDGGLCASIQNIVAELPGREPDAALLVAAHSDSIDAGPGVSDDLAGVAAVLEVARILKTGPQFRNSVLFLIDEGEEGGLLGAREFADSSPDAARVKAVVNLEARGTSGPSLMFETGPADAWLMPHLSSVPHPRTSSLFSTLYQYLPNDTDFTVFKRRGLSGFNFAYIGDPAHYHTPLDNLANISLASLQHHGENALATVRALGNADITRPQRGKAVFFDLFGFALVWWPEVWSLILAVAALLLIVFAAVRLIRSRRVTGGAAARGVLAWLAALVLVAAVGFALSYALRLAGLRARWPAHGHYAVAAFWFLALALVAAAGGLFRRAGFFGLWIGAWLYWGLFGLVTAILLPGASYLFLVPALVAGLAGLALPGKSGEVMWAAILPALAAGVVWFPILSLLYDGLGSGALFLIGALIAIALTPLLPLAAVAGRPWRRMVPAAALLLAVGLCVPAVTLPAFTKDSTRSLNINFLQDDGKKEARWVILAAPPLPTPVRQTADFKPGPSFPWFPQFVQGFSAPAPLQDLPGPELTVVRNEITGEKRHLLLHLASPRGAAVALIFPPESAGLESAVVGGDKIAFRRPSRGLQSLGSLTLPPGGIDIDLVLGTSAPQAWYVVDRTPGLPGPGATLARSRPDWTSTGHEGDVTMVFRKIEL